VKKTICVVGALLALTGCGKEKSETLSPYEAADMQATSYNFQLYPGAQYLAPQTELFRRAHFVLQPAAKTAPPMAMYETDASLEDVAKFYGEKYGYTIAENETNNFSSVKPQAYYTQGDLAADTMQVKPILEQLKVQADLTKASGPWRGVHISPKTDYPRVTLQRPYFDFTKSQTVDRTLVLMVKE